MKSLETSILDRSILEKAIERNKRSFATIYYQVAYPERLRRRHGFLSITEIAVVSIRENEEVLSEICGHIMAGTRPTNVSFRRLYRHVQQPVKRFTSVHWKLIEADS